MHLAWPLWKGKRIKGQRGASRTTEQSDCRSLWELPPKRVLFCVPLNPSIRKIEYNFCARTPKSEPLIL